MKNGQATDLTHGLAALCPSDVILPNRLHGRSINQSDGSLNIRGPAMRHFGTHSVARSSNCPLSLSVPSSRTVVGSNATCSKTSSMAATLSWSCNGLISNGSGLCTGGGGLANSYYEAWDMCLGRLLRVEIHCLPLSAPPLGQEYAGFASKVQSYLLPLTLSTLDSDRAPTRPRPTTRATRETAWTVTPAPTAVRLRPRPVTAARMAARCRESMCGYDHDQYGLYLSGW
jgi:hypothetical protein